MPEVSTGPLANRSKSAGVAGPPITMARRLSSVRGGGRVPLSPVKRAYQVPTWWRGVGHEVHLPRTTRWQTDYPRWSGRRVEHICCVKPDSGLEQERTVSYTARHDGRRRLRRGGSQRYIAGREGAHGIGTN